MKEVYINCDGGSRGNPGKAAIGVVLSDKNKKILEEKKKQIGKTTNNVAEYNSLIEALKLAVKYTNSKVFVFMDSELVIRQMKGRYRVRAKHLLPLYHTAKALEENFESVEYNHVSRWNKFQQKADKLVNQALDSN